MTDVGEGGGGSVPATKALVFMINAINDRFKITLAHFFVDSLTGKANYNDILKKKMTIQENYVKILI